MNLKNIYHITILHDRFDTRIFQKQCVSLKNKYNVTLIVNDGRGNSNKNGIRIIDLNCKNKFRLFRLFRFGFYLNKMLNIEKPNIIQIHDPELLLFIGIIKKHKIKIVFDLHDDLVEQILEKEYIAKNIRKYISKVTEIVMKYFLKRVDGIITAAEYMTNIYKIYNKNAITLWNYPIENKIEKKIKYEIKNKIKILFIGTAYTGRSIEDLCEVLSKNEYNNKYSFTIIGNTSQQLQSNISRYVNKFELNIIKYIDYDELYKNIKNFDIGFVCDYNYKRNKYIIPIKLLEYMAAGLPVIISNMPMIENIVKKYNNGYIVDLKEKNRFENVLNRIYEMPDILKTFGENSKNAIFKEYNWKNEELKLLDYYELILNSSNKEN